MTGLRLFYRGLIITALGLLPWACRPAMLAQVGGAEVGIIESIPVLQPSP